MRACSTESRSGTFIPNTAAGGLELHALGRDQAAADRGYFLPASYSGGDSGVDQSHGLVDPAEVCYSTVPPDEADDRGDGGAESCLLAPDRPAWRCLYGDARDPAEAML